MHEPRANSTKRCQGLLLASLAALSLSACHRMKVYERSYRAPISSQNFQDVDGGQVNRSSTIVRGRGHWEPGHECSSNCGEYEPPVTGFTPIESAPVTTKRVVIVEQAPVRPVRAGFYTETVVYTHGHHLHRCGPSCGYYYSTRRVYLHGHHLHVCTNGCRFYSGVRYTFTNSRQRRHHRRHRRHRSRFGFSFGSSFNYCR